MMPFGVCTWNVPAALHKIFCFTHMMFWVQMFYLCPWLTVKCQWSTLHFKLLCLFLSLFFVMMRVGQKCSGGHCQCGLGKMLFQVSGISVLPDQMVRWLTDKKRAPVCGGDQSPGPAAWLVGRSPGFDFSALLPCGLEQISQGVFKNSGQLSFPWEADCAEEHRGALVYPESAGKPCVLSCWPFCLSSVKRSCSCCLSLALV